MFALLSSVYLKYNASLRYSGALSAEGAEETRVSAKREFDKYCEGNKYSSTLHAINSAIVKLGKLSKAQKVYRGIANKVSSHPASP